LDLATSYCEEGLKSQCEKLIKNGINEDNAAMLFAAAIKYEAEVSAIRLILVLDIAFDSY